MSRRGRITELRATIKYLGKQGINDLVYGLHESAVQFAKELEMSKFRVLNHVVFNQGIVACENDDITAKTLKIIQNSGECWCGSARYKDLYVIRISVCCWTTTSADVTRSVNTFIKSYHLAKTL